MTPDPTFSEADRAILANHFSNVDEPVFALTGLPDVVKGALFARYSRSPKSLRQLFLDEFHEEGLVLSTAPPSSGVARAEELYERMLVEYGDDSVAQLVGVHVAVEGASNIMTKVLEWGRLLSYLEQSTRYIPYNQQLDGRWRYHVPDELADSPLRDRFIETMDECFETYASWFERVETHLRERFPKAESDTKTAYRLSIRAKTCDILRGLLPAATTANVGIFGSAQGFEALLLRLQEHPLAEARATGESILRELRKVIPVFMRRVDRADRGGAWSRYLRQTSDATATTTMRLLGHAAPEVVDAPYVRLTDFEADGEVKVLSAAMYPHARLGDAALLAAAAAMSAPDRAALLAAYVGERTNRRHRPGRAFERTSYRFEVVTDYGAFRDLQRHRMLTLDWQPLSPDLGYAIPREIEELGGADDWRRVMASCAALYGEIQTAGLPAVAPYTLPMAYRIRFYMQMNAREAMQMIELRTTPQGHPAYRWVCQEMLRRIDDTAGHHAIAESMRFADMQSDADLGRLEAERRKEERVAALAAERSV